MAIAENRGQQIFFEDVGSGTPLVLGHSFLCSGAMWRGQVQALADRCRIVNIDLRGHGRSGPAHQPFSLYDAVGDVIAVLDLLGIGRAVWCGLSIGGMVAMRAALTHPDRVAALILLFSILVPLTKAAILAVILAGRRQVTKYRLYLFVRSISKWSMADVFAVGVFIALLAAKGTDNLDATAGLGFYCFAGYCLVSNLAFQALHVPEPALDSAE